MTRTGGSTLAGAAIGFLVTAPAAFLSLHNVMGPMDEPGNASWLAALGIALTGAVLLASAAHLAAARWFVPTVLTLGVVCLAGLVVQPSPIDVQESFVPRVNERSSCTGWSFTHYPPGVMDGSAVIYCVGFETPIAPG